MEKATSLPTTKQGLSLHEDWVSVILGFAIIFISLVWFLLPTPDYAWNSSAELSSKVFSQANIAKIITQFVYAGIVAVGGALLIGKKIKHVLYTYTIIYLLTVVVFVIAGNDNIKKFNLEAVIFSLAIGLLIGNLIRLPEWFKAALSTELFVKIGLVLLGTTIVFSDILEAGARGLAQALMVVVSVWYFAYWVCKKLRLDDELTMMISSAVSICGVSAAIATAGAIKGDPKKLSYVISMVLIIAVPMMIFMPAIASYFHFPQEVTGAWLGGSIDTTPAVAASSKLVGDEATKISAIVKLSQNVLLGLAAFAISLYWTYTDNKGKERTVEKPTLRIIWERFPKFVIGFVAASLFFSFMSPATIGAMKGSLKSIQTLWFVLAFISIGLETRFSDLFNSNSRKPLYAFLIAQVFNIIITLIVAFMLFG